jgi:holliday junction DNA helicase RuvA
MISALTGHLVEVNETSIDLRAGPVVFTVLIPACDVPRMQEQIGGEVKLWTLMYLEGDASRGNLEPRVVGFLQKDDRAFFELFTTVKGIGPKTALKALTEPIEAIAGWIESRDAKSLTRLSGIGKRTAELVIAELSGKCGKFSGPVIPGESARPAATPSRRPPAEEDAIRALCSLGERRLDAESLLERVRQRSKSMPHETNQLVKEMLRIRAAG